MHWLETTEAPPPLEGPPSSRRAPPRLPGIPEMPPMPVEPPASPAATDKTIEVDPQWLEVVKERRAKNAEDAKAAAARPRPNARPLIPREDD